MAKYRSYRHSNLFTVRLWSEAVRAGRRTADNTAPSEWRGQVRHVLSGETRYFHDWSTLITHLQTLLANCESDSHSTDPDS